MVLGIWPLVWLQGLRQLAGVEHRAESLMNMLSTPTGRYHAAMSLGPLYCLYWPKILLDAPAAQARIFRLSYTTVTCAMHCTALSIMCVQCNVCGVCCAQVKSELTVKDGPAVDIVQKYVEEEEKDREKKLHMALQVRTRARGCN